MQETAALRGGKCLSKQYENSATKLTWRCEKGHTWDMTSHSIKQGGWCRQCIKVERKKLCLEEMHEIAYSRGGRCLSKKYISSYTKLKWQCKEGHTWHAMPNTVKRGTWCPHCYGNIKQTMEEMQEMALARGGKCLSKTYINANTKLIWQCKEGHTWSTMPYVIRAKKWCPYCAGKAKLTIEEMDQIAQAKGGKCLSKKYIDIDTKLKWQCNVGHTWSAVANAVKRGSWCPCCYGKIKLTIEEMQGMVLTRGGKCLSKTYINKETKLSWRCKEGHIWQATPGSIRQGTWCPYCARRVKLTIEEMYQIARAKGGKCLSKTYINNSTKLKWQCKDKHTWKAMPYSVKQYGSWCPICAINKRKTRK